MFLRTLIKLCVLCLDLCLILHCTKIYHCIVLPHLCLFLPLEAGKVVRCACARGVADSDGAREGKEIDRGRHRCCSNRRAQGAAQPAATDIIISRWQCRCVNILAFTSTSVQSPTLSSLTCICVKSLVLSQVLACLTGDFEKLIRTGVR